MNKLIFRIFIIIFLLYGLQDLCSQERTRTILFNAIGQKELVKKGEVISIVLGSSPSIKTEYIYYSYLPSKNPDEYYIKLESNEPYFKEINKLTRSIDSIRSTKIAEKPAPEQTTPNATANQAKPDVIPLKPDSIKRKKSIIQDSMLYFKNDYPTLFNLNKIKNIADNLKKLEEEFDNPYQKNLNNIELLKNKINSSSDPDEIRLLKHQKDSLELANTFLSRIKEEISKANRQLEYELMMRKIYIFVLLVVIFLIILLTIYIYRNYRQKKIFSAQLLEYNTQLTEKNDIINRNLRNAAEYVRTLIPKPIIEKNAYGISTEWIFEPSDHLGGDSFGYNKLNDDLFAFYLLDVSGHGIGPSLHSVQVLSLLHLRTLPKANLSEPKEVMKELNYLFQMKDFDDMYFTIWYGVYNKKTNKLKFASAGHPPALLFNDNKPVKLLSSQNLFIGATKKIEFIQDEIELTKPATLYIYSDGVYELMSPTGKLFTNSEFCKMMSDKFESGSGDLNVIYEFAKSYIGKPGLEDDFSILKLKFE